MPASAGIVSVEGAAGLAELLVRDARSDSYARFNCRRTGFRRESQCCLRSGVAAGLLMLRSLMLSRVGGFPPPSRPTWR